MDVFLTVGMSVDPKYTGQERWILISNHTTLLTEMMMMTDRTNGKWETSPKSQRKNYCAMVAMAEHSLA